MRQSTTTNGRASKNIAPPVPFVAFPQINEVLLPVAVTDAPTIQCKRCKEWKPRTEEYFYRHKKRNWWQSWCKSCQKARMVQVRAARKQEASTAPNLNSPRVNATLKYLRQQLDVTIREEVKTQKALTGYRNTRARIEQAITALLREETAS